MILARSSIRRTREIIGSTESFVAAAQQNGFGWIPDLNDVGGAAGLPSGVGAVPLNIVDGVRIGPGAAYLLPALERANLSLLTQTRAVRLRFSGGRVVGVDAIGPGGPITVTADRIVLSAGAIESAHLLMLSGVGDEAMLRAAGVDVVARLPVGMACSDHPEWVLPTTWEVAAGRPVLEVVLSTPDDIEIRPYTGGFVAMVGDGTAGHPDWPHIGVALMRPLARGRITLVSSDPLVPPKIEHRYDSEPGDVAALQRGIELARELAGSTTQIGEPAWSTSQHLCGSAPMGGAAGSGGRRRSPVPGARYRRSVGDRRVGVADDDQPRPARQHRDARASGGGVRQLTSARSRSPASLRPCDEPSHQPQLLSVAAGRPDADHHRRDGDDQAEHQQ